jgi:hypothetical protein
VCWFIIVGAIAVGVLLVGVMLVRVICYLCDLYDFCICVIVAEVVSDGVTLVSVGVICGRAMPACVDCTDVVLLVCLLVWFVLV